MGQEAKKYRCERERAAEAGRWKRVFQRCAVCRRGRQRQNGERRTAPTSWLAWKAAWLRFLSMLFPPRSTLHVHGGGPGDKAQ